MKILPGIVLVIKLAIRLVGLVRKSMEYGHPVFDMLNSLLMVVLLLYIKIMWIATVERSVKKQCGFIILSSSKFSIPSTKNVEKIHFVCNNHSLYVCHFNHDEYQEHTNLYKDTPKFEYLWLGERI